MKLRALLICFAVSLCTFLAHAGLLEDFFVPPHPRGTTSVRPNENGEPVLPAWQQAFNTRVNSIYSSDLRQYLRDNQLDFKNLHEMFPDGNSVDWHLTQLGRIDLLVTLACARLRTSASAGDIEKIIAIVQQLQAANSLHALNMRDQYEDTVLHTAVRVAINTRNVGLRQLSLQVIRFLIAHGANPYIINASDATPLSMAQATIDMPVIALLTLERPYR